ncbi:MAG TPA: hypothetical protein VFS62_00975 [Chloroflexota bacterium]|nr:hypothetical protein [Chloroflexota bacterium]
MTLCGEMRPALGLAIAWERTVGPLTLAASAQVANTTWPDSGDTGVPAASTWPLIVRDGRVMAGLETLWALVPTAFVVATAKV